MSKSSKKSAKNYEQLYLKLKEEYELMEKENNEIFKEYESTIQMLTDSIKELQNQRSSMTKKLSQVEKERENLQNKNRDKLIDIEELNKENEKLTKEIKFIQEDKRLRDSKIIALENDTDHFQKLIRQNEAVIDELSLKLEEALEDNVTIQTEFEIYKEIIAEKLLRKDQELKEIKNDMFSKNLMINKLKKKKDEENSFSDKMLLRLRLDAAKSTNKKDRVKDIEKINKMNKIRHSYTYSFDTGISLSLSFNKENGGLFKQINQNNCKNDETRCHTKSKNKPISPLLSLISTIKIDNNKKEVKLFNSSSKNNKTNSNSSELRTPSNNKIIKINNNSDSNFYFGYTCKKLNDDIEFKNINKFEIDENDSINSNIKEEKNIFKNDNNDNNFSLINDNDFISNCIYNRDLSKNKADGIESLKDKLVKKILNSKKLSNNLEKLMNIGQRIKGTKNKKWKNKKERIGHKLK